MNGDSMDSESKACPKCGGEMRQGDMLFDVSILMANPMSPMGGFSAYSAATMSDQTTASPHWEEKTGRRKGFILKSDETKKMTVKGYRCILCGYIELYAAGEKNQD
jgi:predicted nucleic-acid-binding Zn-ribbon protein